MITLSTEWLSVCGGCHVAILDLDLGVDDELKTSLDRILGEVEIVRCPPLMDEKGYPDADVGIITGAIRSDHDRKAARLMRESCRLLIGFGTCAVFGGISGAGYVHSPEKIMNAVYRDNPTTVNPDKVIPDQIVPPLERIPMPVDEEVKIDLYLPGCPPHRYYIYESLLSLLEKRAPKVEAKSVCSKCNRVMEKSDVGSLKRWLEDIPCDDDKCFLSQGYLCLGSVTIDRCLLPCCPNQGMPCIGCAGPTPQVILEPNRDIRTEIAERISRLAIKKKEGEKEEKFEERLEERYKDVLKDIELFSKTHYAFVMASPLIHRKNTFNIKKWIHEAEEAKL